MKDIRLLLVDDELDFRRTIAKRLSRRGIEPRQAGSGEACLSILEESPMDVVVLDVKMPGMNGIEVLEHIKRTLPRTEVILLTGYASTEDGVRGIKAGAFDYLTKPVELDHLLSKIQQAYEKCKWAEERERESEFRTKMEQQMAACERLASLGTLAAGVAHEINNPLAIIKESVGWMKLLLEKETVSSPPRKENFELALSKIEKAIERVKRITLQLLGFARKDDAIIKELNLVDVVNEALQLVEREARNKDIEIAQEVDAGSGPIWCDPYRLRQVLINLLTNAIQATGKGGKVTVGHRVTDDKVTLTVTDTGEGIPRENLERIFEPFFSTKAPGQGTGLGLFVTRGIVEKFGGTIAVESRLGRGSSFTVTLPKYCEIRDDLTERASSILLQRLTEPSRSYQI
jgi:signal transduction histidine kinase